MYICQLLREENTLRYVADSREKTQLRARSIGGNTVRSVSRKTAAWVSGAVIAVGGATAGIVAATSSGSGSGGGKAAPPAGPPQHPAPKAGDAAPGLHQPAGRRYGRQRRHRGHRHLQ